DANGLSMLLPCHLISGHEGCRFARRPFDGPTTIILVTGAMCARNANARLAELLFEHFTVINYDHRGRGDSDDRGDTPPFSLQREIEDIAALIAEAGGSACLVGLSSGGALVLEAAALGYARGGALPE